jgi:hypothetical protein
MMSVNCGLLVAFSVCFCSGSLPSHLCSIMHIVGDKVKENMWLIVVSEGGKSSGGDGAWPP